MKALAMLELWSNEVKLDLPTDWQVDFEEDWNLFDFSKFSKDFSWSFVLPDTPKNRKALGFPHLIESRNGRNKFIEVSLILASKTWKRGLLYFNEAVPGGFEVSFSGALSKFSSALQNKKLADLNWPFISFSGSASTHMMNVASVPLLNDYTFFQIELLNGGSSQFLNKLVENSNIISFDIAQGFPSPQPYVYKILKRMETDYGFRLVSELFKQTEMQRLVLLSNKKLAPPYRTNNFFSPYTIGPSMPDMGLSDFLKELAKYFCLYIDYDDKTEELRIDSRKSILESTEEEDWSEALIDLRPMHANKKTYQVTYTYNEADADLSSSAFEKLAQPPRVEGAEEVSCAWGTIYSETNGNDLVSARLNGSIGQNITPTLLFYRGVFDTPFPTYSEWPIATAGDFGSFQYNTYWNGAKGVYDVYWKPFLSLAEKMTPAKALLKLTPDKLIRYNPRKVYRLGRYRVVFSKLTYSVSHNGISNAEAEVLVF